MAPQQCPACAMVEASLTCGALQAGCVECQCRAVAHGPVFFEAARAGGFTPAYRQLLHSTFGKDWQSAHARAKAWADKWRAARAGARR